VAVTTGRPPITMQDWRARGWLDGLEDGFAQESDSLGLASDQDRRVPFAAWRACGTVSLRRRVLNDGVGHNRIFDESPLPERFRGRRWLRGER